MESNKIGHKRTYLQNRNRLRHWEQTCGYQGGGVGEGWIGSLGLADANYYIQNGYTTRSYCIAQGTIFNILWQTIMEKNMKKLHIEVCITDSLCHTEEINTTL